MAGWIPHVRRLVGAVVSLGGAVWSIVAWIWGGGLAAVFSYLGPPEFASLLAMFTAAMVFFCWRLCQPFLPSRRLEAMSEDILGARRSLDWIRGKKSSSIQGRIEEEIRIVARELDGIKVPHPPIEGSVKDWYAFLVRLQAEAKTRNARCARAIWEKMQRELED